MFLTSNKAVALWIVAASNLPVGLLVPCLLLGQSDLKWPWMPTEWLWFLPVSYGFSAFFKTGWKPGPECTPWLCPKMALTSRFHCVKCEYQPSIAGRGRTLFKHSPTLTDVTMPLARQQTAREHAVQMGLSLFWALSFRIFCQYHTRLK